MSQRGRFVSVGIGMAIYTAALLLPAFEIEVLSTPQVFPGWEALWIGAQLFWGILQERSFDPSMMLLVYWLANPALFIAWVSLGAGRYRVSAVLSTVGLLLTWVMFCQGFENVGFQPGFWCWSLSMMWIALISLKPALQRASPEISGDGGRAAARSVLTNSGSSSS